MTESESDAGWKGLVGQIDFQLEWLKESESVTIKRKWYWMKWIDGTDRLSAQVSERQWKWWQKVKVMPKSESDAGWKGLVGQIDLQLKWVKESESDARWKDLVGQIDWRPLTHCLTLMPSPTWAFSLFRATEGEEEGFFLKKKQITAYVYDLTCETHQERASPPSQAAAWIREAPSRRWEHRARSGWRNSKASSACEPEREGLWHDSIR